ncbi:hypothetical protein HK097_006186 [Rhizophlyctis rosea]|uniref:D-lactate dehydratase n=1 Tax=Rhizophlyctis rosea TaxID=64517 RepID=A0AAD5SJ50_9FUNG|nr:hypothetical protein HK097_006186 [Rhizophlyctis rosea]
MSTTTASNKGKVLVILSGSDHLELGNGKDQPTGFFLCELAQPLAKLLEEGYEPVFANPTGKKPIQDPLSDSLLFFLGNTKEREREHKLINSMSVSSNLSNPIPFASITDDQLHCFKGVFVPGGHAPMEDLFDDKELGRILLHFHARQKTTGAICHGPVALLSTRAAVKPGEKFPYAGYNVTAYSDTEEKLNEVMFGSQLKFKVVDELQKEGATICDTFPMGSKVTVDRELVTGQGPTSAAAFADAFVKHLNKGSAVAA